jgi:ADP-heptose:LPS heptosyltransferase
VEKRGDRPFLDQMLGYIGCDSGGSPRIYLEEEEIARAEARFPGKYIAVCPVGKTIFSANRRDWGLEKFQKTRDLLSEYKFVQVGLETDPLLNNVLDARGLSIRESAAVLRNAWFFLGLEGGFMHVAKAVDTRSVIVFGGYILPEVSGYSGNVNISSEVDCSPCYNSHEFQGPCDSMKCMKAIDAAMVYERIVRELIGRDNEGK